MTVSSSSMHYFWSGLVAALSGSPLSIAVAQTQEPLEQVVVTATRQAENLQQFNGSISVLGGDDVALVGSTHHSELLNRVPGGMTQRNSGQESLTALRSPVLSGPGSCGAFLFLENSVPIRPTGFCNVNELFEVHTEQADSIEVLRGPAGVVYGSGAMHGAINVLSGAAPDSPLRSFIVEGGSDQYYRSKFRLRHSANRSDFGAALTATRDGGWRDQSGFEEQKLSVSVTHRHDDAVLGLDVAATHLKQETAGFIQGFNAYRNRAIAESNPNPEAYRNASALRLIGRYEQALSERMQLAVRPFARHSRMDFIQHFLIGKPLEDNGQDSAGVISTLNIDAFDATRILTGIDLELARGFLKETQPRPATDGTPAANAIRPIGKHYDYRVNSRVAAAYAQIEQPVSQRLSAIGGARFEHVSYRYDNRMIDGNTAASGSPCTPAACLFNRPADRRDTFRNVTSKLGLSYRPNERHTVFLHAARGYRAPDTSELYRLQRQQAVADLDAERLDSVELGVRGDFGSLRYSFAAFRMQKDNVIFRDSNAFNVSDGRTKHRGIEYDIDWRLHSALSLAFVGTYAVHRYDFSRAIEQGETIVAGRDVDTAPRHIHAARLQWRPLASVATEVEWQSVGKYFVDTSNAQRYNGHDLLNVRANWRINEHWDTTLRLNNLLDRAYADRADFAFGSYRYFPGRGRSLFAELRYRSH